MSLINKVLQDLERRRASAEPPRPLYEDLRPVRSGSFTAPRRRRTVLSLAAAVVGVLAVAAGSAYYPFRARPGIEPQAASGAPQTELPNERPTASAPETVAAAADASPLAEPKADAPRARSSEPEGSGSGASGQQDGPRVLPVPSAAAASASQIAKIDLGPHPALPLPETRVEPKTATASRRPTAGKHSNAIAPAPRQSASAPLRAQSAEQAPGGGQSGEGLLEKRLKPLTAAEQAEAQYRHAYALLKQGQGEQAEAALRSALAHYPAHASARELLAGLLLQRGLTEQAQAVLEEGIKHGPAPSLARLLARLLVEQGAEDRALSVMEEARLAAGRDAEYLSFLAMLYQRSGRHAEAIAAYSAAVGARPSDGRSWLGLAISLEAQQQRQEAARAYERALRGNGLDGRLRQYAQQRLESIKERP